jgi:D-threo-aldose 1-dehydrogenase
MSGLTGNSRTIGRHQVSMSPLGFGGAPIGNLYTPVSEADAQSAVEAAFARGIRYFDTAPLYGHGLSEERLGRALTGRRRGSFALSTKVGRVIVPDASRRGMADGFAVEGSRAVFDYSRDGVRRSFESSLERLRVAFIDILYLHDIGRATHGERHAEVLKMALDEALPAMAALRDCGAVGAIGIGVNEQDVCLEVLPRFDLDCIMLAGRYTLLEQRNAIELMGQAQTRGVPILAAGPYNSGLLAGVTAPGETYNYTPADESTRARARAVYEECAVERVDVGAAALQFPLAHPAVACVVTGMRTATEVEIAVNRMETRIPAALWHRVRRRGLVAAGAVLPE